MRVGVKLGLYSLAVVAVGGLAAVVGASVGPIDVGASPSHASMSATDSGVGLPGLTVAAGDYRLVTDFDAIAADAPGVLGFRIENAVGSTVTDFDLLHDRRMHLIVLSRNLIDYLHLHPAMDAMGSWTVDVPAVAPGSYRVYTDFRPNGADQVTLAADLLLPGLVEPRDLPVQSPISEVDSLSVVLSGTAATGESYLTFDVMRDGAEIVTEPYLGAAGHLVVIRSGDLGYLHVHPLDGEPGPVSFAAEFPTPGTYRLFFDFSSDGEIHTASFTIDVERSASGAHESHTP